MVKFGGCDYILVGTLEMGGAIATPEDYQHGRCSYAHLFPDGNILRFSSQIGTREELEVVGEYKEAAMIDIDLEELKKWCVSFQECPSCAAKPGAPTPCSWCLQNRKLLTALPTLIKEVKRLGGIECERDRLNIKVRKYEGPDTGWSAAIEVRMETERLRARAEKAEASLTVQGETCLKLNARVRELEGKRKADVALIDTLSHKLERWERCKADVATLSAALAGEGEHADTSTG